MPLHILKQQEIKSQQQSPTSWMEFLTAQLQKAQKLTTNKRTEHTQFKSNYCGSFIKDDHTHYPPLLLMIKKLFKIQTFNIS
jgi:hypothetical protein